MTLQDSHIQYTNSHTRSYIKNKVDIKRHLCYSKQKMAALYVTGTSVNAIGRVIMRWYGAERLSCVQFIRSRPFRDTTCQTQTDPACPVMSLW